MDSEIKNYLAEIFANNDHCDIIWNYLFCSHEHYLQKKHEIESHFETMRKEKKVWGCVLPYNCECISFHMKENLIKLIEEEWSWIRDLFVEPFCNFQMRSPEHCIP